MDLAPLSRPSEIPCVKGTKWVQLRESPSNALYISQFLLPLGRVDDFIIVTTDGFLELNIAATSKALTEKSGTLGLNDSAHEWPECLPFNPSRPPFSESRLPALMARSTKCGLDPKILGWPKRQRYRSPRYI
jgi:hypothetical protein